MEDYNISSTAWNKSLDERYFNYDYTPNSIEDSFNNKYMIFYVVDVFNWITICIGFSLTLVAIFAALSMSKKDHGATVYVINLLISDLIQLCSRISLDTYFGSLLFDLGLIASIGFMMCISMERYLVVAKPLWYRFRRNYKTSVLVCIAVWILSCIILAVYFTAEKQAADIICGVLLLLPLPLFIFFLVGTIKALSEARSVPADEKRRIVSLLVVVLLTYVLLFLPNILYFLIPEDKKIFQFGVLRFIGVFLSPLADSALYILLRKSAADKLLAALHCCKMSNNQEINTTDNDNMSAL